MSSAFVPTSLAQPGKLLAMDDVEMWRPPRKVVWNADIQLNLRQTGSENVAKLIIRQE